MMMDGRTITDPTKGLLDSARPIGRGSDHNLELMMAVQDGDGLWRGPSESRRFPDRETCKREGEDELELN